MSVPNISLRGEKMPSSPIRELAAYADQAKAKGIHVYHLNIGQPDIPTPPEFYQAIHEHHAKVLEYGPSRGLGSFIDSLQRYYHRQGLNHIKKEDILVTTGGSEAVLFLMLAIASPGDEIIVFDPIYTNYNGFAHMAGVKLVPVHTDAAKGYRMPDKDDIRKHITNKTRAILTCSPNNPTGMVHTQDDFAVLQELVLEHNLFLICDEVYREFTYDDDHISVMSFPEIEQHVAMVDSLSKRYSVCGARIGCIVSKNQQLMRTILKFGQARLCPPTLEQLAMQTVVDVGDKYFIPMRETYRKRRDVLVNGLQAIPGIRCQTPPGAFYLMATLPVENSGHFAKWLLSEFNIDNATAMIAPGAGFYASPGFGQDEVRIAYVINTRAIIKAIEIIQKGLEVYPGR